MSKTEHTPEYLLSLNELRNQTLSEESHARIRADLSEYADFHTVPEASARPGVMPAHSFFAQLLSHRPYFAGVAALLLVVLLTGGTAYASEDALPGDILYTVKVNVSEPVQLALAGTAEDKAEVHATLAERRLDEAAKLAVGAHLDADTAAYLERTFSEHVDKSLAAADELEETGKVDESITVRSDLEARLEARNEILALVADHLEVSGGTDAVIATTKSLLHTLELRREVVSDTRLALERDREDSASKSDTLALVTKASDAGVATNANVRNSARILPHPVSKRIDDAADALTEAQESLEGNDPQDTRHAYRKAQEASRASEVATILLKNSAFLMSINHEATTTDATATTTADGTSTSTVPVASERPDDD